MRAAGRYASTFCTGTKVQVLTVASRYTSTFCTGTNARVLTQKVRCALLAVTMLHGFIMVICENILSYQMDRDFKMSRALNGLSSTVGLCASASKPPSFFLFHSHPPLLYMLCFTGLIALRSTCGTFRLTTSSHFRLLVLAYITALLTCITLRATCGSFRRSLPLDRALLEALIE
jgi:hypothetical protein